MPSGYTHTWSSHLKIKKKKLVAIWVLLQQTLYDDMNCFRHIQSISYVKALQLCTNSATFNCNEFNYSSDRAKNSYKEHKKHKTPCPGENNLNKD